MPEVKGSDPNQISAVLNETRSRMAKAVENLKRELAAIRSTRASASMVDHIQVEYYGSMLPINQVATISVPEPRMILLTPFDRSAMQEIEKAIMKSDLNITPQNDGSVVRLVLPELTRERRQELVKQVKHKLEECRVAIRNIRRDANDEGKKLTGKGHSEDEVKSLQDEIQKLTNSNTQKAEEMSAEKEASIMQV